MGPAARRALWGIGIYIAIIGLIFYASTKVVLTKQESQSLLRAIDWSWVVFGWLFMCSALWALGYRWRALLPSANDASGSFLGASLCSGLLLNYAIPGPFGEVAAAWLVHKRYQIPMSESLTGGMVARLLGLATAALAVVVIWLLCDVQIDPGLWFFFQVSVAGVFGGFCFLLVLMMFPAKILDWLSNRAKNKIIDGILAVLNSLVQLNSGGRWLQATWWSVVGHLLAYFGIVFALWGVVGEVSLVGVGFTYAVGTCLGAVAFLFPGSQVTWDAMFAGLLIFTVGLTPVAAGVSTLVLRIAQLCMMSVGAIVLPVLYRSIKRDL